MRKYDFGYDPANRLLKADFTQLESAAWTNTNMNFNVKMGDGADPNSAYDANGNILRMQQWGWKIGGSEQIDDLNYTYYANSNKLQNVIDLHNDPDTKLGDFKTSVLHPDKTLKDSYVPGGSIDPTTITDYTYDANGNLKRDLNKDIATATNGDGIEYNYLNLPQKITVKKNGGIKGTIEYTYDAAGNKQKKKVVETGVTVQTDSGPQVSDITTTTTYVGSFIYESKSYSNTAIATGYTDQLQFFGQEEGRIRPVKDASGSITSFAFDYFIKDHLGNIRMVLTDEQRTDKYPTATLEEQMLDREGDYYAINSDQIVPNAEIEGISDYSNDNGIGNNPDDPDFETSTSQFMYKLNGDDAKTGLGITLKVMAGDEINIYGKSYYFENNDAGGDGNSNITTLEILSGLLGGPGNVVSASGHANIIASDLDELPSTTEGIATFLENQQGQYDPNSPVPKASINYLIFNEQFKCIGSGFSSVDGAGELKDHQQYLQDIPIPQNGYIYIYCSNESPVNVFFDNLQVTHKRSPILEETHYYPFGLQMSGISSKAAGGMENKIKFNDIEQNNDFDLNMYDAHYRNLDPQLGRFWQIDPKPNENFSPYAAMANNPLLYSDPLGDTTWLYNQRGVYVGTVNDNLANQTHFLNLDGDPGTPLDLSGLSAEQVNAYGASFRKLSVAFMGSNTAADMKAITDAATGDNKEIMFTGSVGKDKEIRLTAVKTDKGEYAKIDDVDKILDQKYTKGQQAGMFLFGHVHPQKPSTGGTIQIGGGTNPLYEYTRPSSPTSDGSGDYGPYLYRSATATQRGQSPALVLSRWGFTVYGTASSSGPNPYGGYNVKGEVRPGTESYYLYKQLKK